MLKSTFLLLNAVSVVTPLLVQAPPASTGRPTEVVLLNGNQKTQLTGTKPEERSRNVRVLILGFSTDLLTIGGLKSAHRISTGTPAFLFTIPPGVEPAETVILTRLKPKDGRREVHSDRDSASGVRDEDVVPLTFALDESSNLAASRLYRAAPKVPLKAGEYAVVVKGLFYDFGVD
jgi:hypothetical protein